MRIKNRSAKGKLYKLRVITNINYLTGITYLIEVQENLNRNYIYF